jgi:hypothetical protein
MAVAVAPRPPTPPSTHRQTFGQPRLPRSVLGFRSQFPRTVLGYRLPVTGFGFLLRSLVRATLDFLRRHVDIDIDVASVVGTTQEHEPRYNGEHDDEHDGNRPSCTAIASGFVNVHFIRHDRPRGSPGYPGSGLASRIDAESYILQPREPCQSRKLR